MSCAAVNTVVCSGVGLFVVVEIVGGVGCSAGVGSVVVVTVVSVVSLVVFKVVAVEMVVVVLLQLHLGW